MIIVEKIAESSEGYTYRIKSDDDYGHCFLQVFTESDGTLSVSFIWNGITNTIDSNKLSYCIPDILVGENTVTFTFEKITKRGVEKRLVMKIRALFGDFFNEIKF